MASDGADVTCCGRLFQIRGEERRPEKLGHRRLTAAYGGHSVTMPRRNADDIELRCLLAGRIRRRGTAVLHLADTWSTRGNSWKKHEGPKDKKPHEFEDIK